LFIREFIVNCFKDYSVFWDFHYNIIDVSLKCITEFKKEYSSEAIKDLINDIVERENNKKEKGWYKYNKITKKDVEKFKSID
jgi:3-hydroxyacyl-CoA dehydrogenase